MIVKSLINRGEITSLNLWVQSGIKPRIHKNTFSILLAPSSCAEAAGVEESEPALSILEERRDAPSSPPPSPPPTVLTLNPVLL
jgi:hypothetical protein